MPPDDSPVPLARVNAVPSGRVRPDDAEAGGGRMVAVVQLAIALGATVAAIIRPDGR
jgi:predicted MFS family arabinose efflux permease